MTGVSLTGVSLTGSSLTGVSFTGSSFTGTSLTGVSLTGSALIGVSLTGVSLTGVSLTGAPCSAGRHDGLVGERSRRAVRGAEDAGTTIASDAHPGELHVREHERAGGQAPERAVREVEVARA